MSSQMEFKGHKLVRRDIDACEQCFFKNKDYLCPECHAPYDVWVEAENTTAQDAKSKASNWTVKELIEKLRVVPEDAQVYICSEDCGWEYPATGFGINYNGDRTEVVIY